MDLYPLLAFAHVLGAVGLFAALAIEVLAFSRLQRAATVAQARSWLALVRGQGRIAIGLAAALRPSRRRAPATT